MLGDKTQPTAVRLDAAAEEIRGLRARLENQAILIRDQRMRIEDLSQKVLNLAVLDSRVRKLEAEREIENASKNGKS